MTEKGDDYFKLDVEAHLAGKREIVSYYPGVQMWNRAAEGVLRALFFPLKVPAEFMKPKPTAEDLIGFMDKYRVDLACIVPESMMDTTGYATPWITNAEAAIICEKYPKRFIFCPNLGPIKVRGIENVLWELEYLVKERNAKAIKLYPPEDTYMNDPEIYPFYKKCVELDVPVFIHTGYAWVPPGRAKYCDPMQLDDVATDFPDLTIVAYHGGWPYPHVLNLTAATHPNIYIGFNLIYPWAISAPRQFAELIGEALRMISADRIVWGTDVVSIEAPVKYSVEGFMNFQMPEDLQQGYGYPALTEEDRRKIFGLNAAKILKIEPNRRI